MEFGIKFRPINYQKYPISLCSFTMFKVFPKLANDISLKGKKRSLSNIKIFLFLIMATNLFHKVHVFLMVYKLYYIMKYIGFLLTSFCIDHISWFKWFFTWLHSFSLVYCILLLYHDILHCLLTYRDDNWVGWVKFERVGLNLSGL